MIIILTNKDLTKSNASKSITEVTFSDFRLDTKPMLWADGIIYVDNKAFKIIKSRDISGQDIFPIDKLNEFIEIILIRSLGQSNFIATKK